MLISEIYFGFYSLEYLYVSCNGNLELFDAKEIYESVREWMHYSMIMLYICLWAKPENSS